MKDWQKGYELDTLIEWTNKFDDYNKYCHSPFAKAKKNGMANALSENKLFEKDSVVYEMRTAKTTSKVKMFGAGPEIATVEKGEKVITKLSAIFNPDDTTPIRTMTEVLNTIEEPVWCHIFEEDGYNKEAVKNAGFKKIGTKVSTFSDIIGVYYKGGRKFIPVPETENINIIKTKLEFDHSIIDVLVDELISMNLKYTNHNSNYNKNKSWQALSLLGHEADSTYVDKHLDGFHPIVQTDLYKKLEKEVKHFLGQLPGRFDRVRFMTLKPGGGELARHTDQTDPDWGTTDEKMVRFHMPLKTNDKVIFTSWDNDGRKHTHNMKKGECWFLDTRRPHTAINGGDDIRIHLVADVWANEDIRRLLKQEKFDTIGLYNKRYADKYASREI
jgi:hypothetical protein